MNVIIILVLFIILFMILLLFIVHKGISSSKSYRFAINYIKSNDGIIAIVGSIKDIHIINKFAVVTRIRGIDEEGLFVIRTIGEKGEVNVKIQVAYDKQGVGKIMECKIVSDNELKEIHKEFTSDW